MKIPTIVLAVLLSGVIPLAAQAEDEDFSQAQKFCKKECDRFRATPDKTPFQIFND